MGGDDRRRSAVALGVGGVQSSTWLRWCAACELVVLVVTGRDDDSGWSDSFLIFVQLMGRYRALATRGLGVGGRTDHVVL